MAAMALYTSYYTKQLALLRPEAAQTFEVNVEGERTIHKSVARRTIDLAGPYINWFEVRCITRSLRSSVPHQAHAPARHVCQAPSGHLIHPWAQTRSMVRSPLDTPALDSSAASALRILPPFAYAHQPASSFAVKFAQQAPSKVGGRAVAYT